MTTKNTSQAGERTPIATFFRHWNGSTQNYEWSQRPSETTLSRIEKFSETEYAVYSSSFGYLGTRDCLMRAMQLWAESEDRKEPTNEL